MLREGAEPQLPQSQVKAETHPVRHVCAPASDPQGLAWEVQEVSLNGMDLNRWVFFRLGIQAKDEERQRVP